MNRITKSPYFLLLASIVLFGANLCWGMEDNMYIEEQNDVVGSFILGTYTNKEFKDGLLLFQYDSEVSEYYLMSTASDYPNTSFGVLNSAKTQYYSVSETEKGKVIAYDLFPDSGTLKLINAKSSMGDYPCYVSLSPNETELAVANYGTGTVAIYEINSNTGAIGGLLKVIKHHGSSLNSSRQEGPHAHWAQWSDDGARLYVVDLGIDKVMRYDREDDWNTSHVALDLTPGSGPRHLAFNTSKRTCYILNELSNSILSANINESGDFSVFQEESTLPSDYSEHSQAGHIAISEDGDFVYVSNRGHDSMAVFKVQQDGSLKRIQIISSGGKWARFFSLTPDETMLWVANQNSDSVSVFHINDKGLLEFLKELPLRNRDDFSQPVFLQFIAK